MWRRMFCSVYETLDERRRFFLPSPWEISICVQATRKSEKPVRNEKINLDLFRDASLKSNIQDRWKRRVFEWSSHIKHHSKYMFRRERKKRSLEWKQQQRGAFSRYSPKRTTFWTHCRIPRWKKKLEDLNLVSTLDRMKYFFETRTVRKMMSDSVIGLNSLNAFELSSSDGDKIQFYTWQQITSHWSLTASDLRAPRRFRVHKKNFLTVSALYLCLFCWFSHFKVKMCRKRGKRGNFEPHESVKSKSQWSHKLGIEHVGKNADEFKLNRARGDFICQTFKQKRVPTSLKLTLVLANFQRT